MALTRVLSDLLMKGKLSTSIGIRNCSVLHRRKRKKKERKVQVVITTANTKAPAL